jgi:hypothetical protein
MTNLLKTHVIQWCWKQYVSQPSVQLCHLALFARNSFLSHLKWTQSVLLCALFDSCDLHLIPHIFFFIPDYCFSVFIIRNSPVNCASQFSMPYFLLLDSSFSVYYNRWSDTDKVLYLDFHILVQGMRVFCSTARFQHQRPNCFAGSFCNNICSIDMHSIINWLLVRPILLS